MTSKADDVTFKIYIDDIVAYSTTVTATSKPQEISLDVSNAEMLKISFLEITGDIT